MRSTAARAVQAKRLSARNPVEAACAGDPGGYGPIEAHTHTLATTRKTGFTPMRNNR
jgi:hypothetical protein